MDTLTENDGLGLKTRVYASRDLTDVQESAVISNLTFNGEKVCVDEQGSDSGKQCAPMASILFKSDNCVSMQLGATVEAFIFSAHNVNDSAMGVSSRVEVKGMQMVMELDCKHFKWKTQARKGAGATVVLEPKSFLGKRVC
ncbi:hypothetical protein ACOSQ2_018351 [Xanthoceras sorbifolium]